MRLSLFPILLLTVSILLGLTISAEAQLRKDLPSAYRLTGPTLMTDHQQRNSSRLFNMVNVSMGHSYEMSMSTFGGNVYNQNMYTNTLFLDFSENFAGRVDVAFAHSPFGQGLPGMNQSGRVFVRNAEFNYRVSDRTQINFQFRQIPGGVGHHGFGSPYGYNSGFGRGWGYDPFYPF